MITFAEAAKFTQNPLEKGVIALYTRYNPVLNYMGFENIAGDSKEWNMEKTLPAAGFRGVNEDWTESEGEYDSKTASLKIMGGRAKVDRFIEATQGNGESTLKREIEQKAKAASLFYLKEFFKGDSTVSTKGFDGLDKLVAAGGGVLVDNASAALTLKVLDNFIDSLQGDPSCLLMSKRSIRIVNDLMRAAGQATEVITDQFGRRLNAYAGIPVEAVEVDNEYNAILTVEDIYAVRFGADGCHGFQHGPLKTLKVENDGVWQAQDIEWYATGPVLRHPKCAGRLTGLVDPDA
jgi:hypothetical protein